MYNKLADLNYDGENFIDLQTNYQRVPEYINENDTFFTNSHIEVNKVNYDRFDKLFRIQGARVVLTKLPTNYQSGRRVTKAKPPGWNNKILYGGEYFYHRTHLIPYMLTGKRAIFGEFFTGTRVLNDSRGQGDAPSMLSYESKIYSALNKDNLKIYYQVTPVYRDAEIVPRGVRITAKSYNLQNKSTDICNFDIYLFNVYPNYEIDYATGKWKEIETNENRR